MEKSSSSWGEGQTKREKGGLERGEVVRMFRKEP